MAEMTNNPRALPFISYDQSTESKNLQQANICFRIRRKPRGSPANQLSCTTNRSVHSGWHV